MSPDQIAQFAYLALLGTAVAGWFFAQNRESLGKTLQQALIWGMIFLGTVAGVGLWSEMRGDLLGQQSLIADAVVEVPQGRDGHYRLTLDVNGVPVDFIVDTGASQVVLTGRDATRVGFEARELRFFGVAETANGTVRTAPVNLELVELEGIRDANVTAVVNEGDMATSLLGMSYLDRFARIEIAGDRLILTR